MEYFTAYDKFIWLGSTTRISLFGHTITKALDYVKKTSVNIPKI